MLTVNVYSATFSQPYRLFLISVFSLPTTNFCWQAHFNMWIKCEAKIDMVYKYWLLISTKGMAAVCFFAFAPT